VRQHFRLQRSAVLKLCADWLRQCQGEDDRQKMRKAVEELRAELEGLGEIGDDVGEREESEGL